MRQEEERKKKEKTLTRTTKLLMTFKEFDVPNGGEKRIKVGDRNHFFERAFVLVERKERKRRK